MTYMCIPNTEINTYNFYFSIITQKTKPGKNCALNKWFLSSDISNYKLKIWDQTNTIFLSSKSQLLSDSTHD